MQHPKPLQIIAFSLWMVLTILQAGCRKEQDEQNPKIEIDSPTENAAFTAGDTIRIAGIAWDESRLEMIRFTLTDLQYIVRDHMVTMTPESNPQHFSVDYILGSELPEGNYLIQVSASDGTNIKYKYLPVRVQSKPRPMNAILVITQSTGNGYSLYSIDTGSTDPVVRGSWPGEYAASAISHQNKQLYVTGKGINDFYALDLEDFTVDFNLQHTGTPSLQYHEALLAAGDRFYLSLTEGFVKGYNKLAVQQYSSTLTTGRKAVMMIREPQNNLMISAEEGQTAPGSWITLTHLGSGMALKEYKLPDLFRVVKLMPVNAAEVLIVGNLNGNGRLYVWNHAQNSLSTLLDLPGKLLNDALPYQSNQFLLAGGGEIVVFDLQQLQTTLFLQQAGVRQIYVDQASQTLMVVGGSSLVGYDLTQKSPKWMIIIPEIIRQVHLRY